ncbi:MAG: glycine zipper domain-containing protein [Desulfurivibrionaceae bacterium]|jgi:uncharacterized protein YcfJ|nr:glycine zipper domain-containing protein [Desulfobulbaceae bacterium]MDP2003903.1 glycine zipper domain-containing protein [Desulfurivibrionaceae bacterium]MDP2757930.1 glycine zipper domain-containing protein [Desulfurivibrionaceae bacterium]PKN20163.1 MAG: hypothetical protein CVU68_09050 [Deltaproteobacteria bacterium HGW-Deltaproteobacteria-3]
MLKRTLLVTCAGLLLATQNVQADSAAQTGALGGAAGGAILGQAIGRNTEGTLLGTAIGGVLGYMVGNEMDKDQGRTGRVYSTPPRVVRQYEDPGDCREVEVLAQVNGRPERVYSTACYENGAWVLQDNSRRVVSQTVIIDRDYYPPGRGHYRHKEKHRWQESRYRPAYLGRPGRDRDNTLIIFR